MTHRGNRLARIFFEEGDREVCCGWLRRYMNHYKLRIWAWSLMTNPSSSAEPEGERSLGLALGHGHGKYAQWVNAHHGLSGHLWQGRFFSTALDEEHLWEAVRYVELNPVRAGLVARVRFRQVCRTGGLGLERGVDGKTLERLRLSTQTGRPYGDESLIRSFEEKLNRLLHPQKPGPKPLQHAELTEDLFS